MRYLELFLLNPSGIEDECEDLEFVPPSNPSTPRFISGGPQFRSACQGIFSLVGNAVTKMLTSMSYSPQPELFARSLRRRLQSLTPDRYLKFKDRNGKIMVCWTEPKAKLVCSSNTVTTMSFVPCVANCGDKILSF